MIKKVKHICIDNTLNKNLINILAAHILLLIILTSVSLLHSKPSKQWLYTTRVMI